MERPNPAHMPSSLVVKNGSEARRSIASSIPIPVSVNSIQTCSPALRLWMLPAFTYSRRSNLETASVRHRIARVQRDIQKREFKLVVVRADRRKAVLESHGNLDRGSERASQHIGHTGDELGDIHGLQLKVRAHCKCKQPFGHQQIIDIMCDAPSELAQAFELLHLLHLGHAVSRSRVRSS